jgi:hypothetical protein
MSLPIYQRVAVTDTGDVIPGAEYTVINENTGVAAPIYSDRTGATLLTPPYFADSVGTIQFFIAQGTTFRVAASGGVGTYTDRYVYGVAEAVLVDAGGNAEIVSIEPILKLEDTRSTLVIGDKLGRLDFYGNDASSAGTGIKASVKAVVEDATGQYVGLAFGTTTNVTPDVERVRIDAYGNVGIGTSSPASLLQIQSSGVSAAAVLSITATNSASSASCNSQIKSLESASGSGSSDLSFHTRHVGDAYDSPQEAMRINSAGNVGIGTTSPSADLELGGIGEVMRLSGSSTNAYIRNTDGATNQWYIGSGGSAGLQHYIYQAQPMTFHTSGTERMRINSAGNFLVGKTSDSVSVGTGTMVYSDGRLFSSIITGQGSYYVWANSGYRFYANANGGISNYSSNNVNLSDEREKKNVEPLLSQWDCLKNWDLKKFHYNADDDGSPKKYGVIAQQVEVHCPEVVDAFKVDETTERKGVKEQQMMWMAIKALQEAQTRIESLEELTQSLITRIEILEAK